MADPLSTWQDDAAKEAILGFVDQTCTDGATGPVPVDERVAVFDNDGTLWCEKPMPIQLDFILRGTSRVRVCTHGRAPRVPAGSRVCELHRLRRRPRLHETDQSGGLRHPP